MPARGPLAMAGTLLAVAAVAAWQVSIMPEAPGFNVVGPSVMPMTMVGLLSVLAALYFLLALTGKAPDAIEDEWESALPGASTRTFVMLLGLALMMILIPLAGIGIAGLATFVCVARAFGSRRLVRDVLVGLCVSFAIWFVFSQWLGVQLGPYARFIPWP
jgi:putative tricarboxylic transport membrane protein